MNFFSAVCTALREDGRTGLATIIGTSGSTPAPSQSRMLVRLPDGARTWGTVGGGCLDESIRWCLTEDPARDKTHLRSFELNDKFADTGLICGGTVHMLLEMLDSSTIRLYEAAASLHSKNLSAFLVTVVRPDGSGEKTLMDASGAILAGTAPSASHLSHVLDAMSRASETERPERVDLADAEIIVEPLLPDPPLLIFGGGHVGKAVCSCAALAGFEVTVVDDREDFAHPERFPEAGQVLCGEFETVLHQLSITPAAHVVIVTRGHKHDELILEHALQHSPKYIGMIGSRRKVLLTLRHLEARGVSPEKLASVHAPIGLDIGALTPGEIAVSIVAELISVRRRTRVGCDSNARANAPAV